MNFFLLERFIHELDAEPKQVLIEATFMEIKIDNELRFGLDSTWNKSLGSLDWNYGSYGAPAAGFDFGFAKGNEWNVTLRALQSNNDTNILSRPKVIIKNNKAAQISVGQEVPYLSVDTTGGATTQRVAFKDISITMDVTPHVEPGERIRMEIKIEIREQIGSVTLAGSETPIISKRTIKTEVFVQSGYTLIMGGLYENKETASLLNCRFLVNCRFLGICSARQ